MNKASLSVFYDFIARGNETAGDTVAHLSEDEFTRPASPSHDTVRQLLIHLPGGEVFYLAARGGLKPCRRPGHVLPCRPMRVFNGRSASRLGDYTSALAVGDANLGSQHSPSRRTVDSWGILCLM